MAALKFMLLIFIECNNSQINQLRTEAPKKIYVALKKILRKRNNDLTYENRKRRFPFHSCECVCVGGRVLLPV